MAIRIKVKNAPKGYDLTSSKFFGSPTIPLKWKNDFHEDEIFLCQIRLSDIAHLDKENRLPHIGYLYVFLNTQDGLYNLKADVRYFNGEPELAINDFNLEVEGYREFNSAHLMEFSEASENEFCTRLLGVPSDWSHEEEPPKLLLQFDPLDSEIGFLEHIDGFLYFFFGKDENNFKKVFLVQEFS